MKPARVVELGRGRGTDAEGARVRTAGEEGPGLGRRTEGEGGAALVGGRDSFDRP